MTKLIRCMIVRVFIFTNYKVRCRRRKKGWSTFLNFLGKDNIFELLVYIRAYLCAYKYVFTILDFY